MTRSLSRRKSQEQAHVQKEGQPKKPDQSAAGVDHELLGLQNQAGNQAVSHLLKNRPITIAEPDDPQEQAADATAAKIQGINQISSSEEAGDQATTSQSSAHQSHLSPEDKAAFEAHLGQDLSQVRLHTDTDAAQLADDLNARAFTVGNDIVFGQGEFNPQTEHGQALLTHELAHVAQQGETDGGQSATVMRKPKDEAKAQQPDEGNLNLPSISLSTAPKPVVFHGEFGVSATIYFEKDRFLLNGENFKAVEGLNRELQLMVDPTVMVDGHASGEGKAEHNQTLSEQRRNIVMLLLGQGLIAQPKFSGSALGASQAAVPETGETETDKEKERALNRRVEITIIQKSTAGAKSPTTSRGKAGSIDNPPFPRLNPADLIKPPSEEELRNERINRMLRTPLPDFKRPKQSLSGLINEKIDEATGKVLKEFGVPRKYHDIIKKGARSLVQKGAESLLDEGLDQAGISGNKKEAIKKAIEAGVKTEL